MDLVTHFQMLARYNRIANERLFTACALLETVEYRQRRAGSFGSIHGLLNHISGGRSKVAYRILGSAFAYTNNQHKDYVETAHVACCHLFNHQTHHRAQVHVMLSQTSTPPPALDLHRILTP